MTLLVEHHLQSEKHNHNKNKNHIMEKEFIYERKENGELILISEKVIEKSSEIIQQEISSKEDELLKLYEEIQRLKENSKI